MPNTRVLLAAVALALSAMPAVAAVAADESLNLAPAAQVSTSFVSGHETLGAVNDGFAPRDSRDHERGAYGNWPRRGEQWVEYAWDRPVEVGATEVYWWADGRGVALPARAKLQVWDGAQFVDAGAVGVAADTFNRAALAKPTMTSRVRLAFDGAGERSTGVLEWRVLDAGGSPPLPPTAFAGEDRVVVLPSATHLHGGGKGVAHAREVPTGKWSKASGPGNVAFADASRPQTTASFDAPGAYELAFTYTLRGLAAIDTVSVAVEERPSVEKLRSVHVSTYKISGPFWRERLKNQIVNWIPHCVARCDDANLAEGGIANFVEAGKKLRGEPAKPHVGYPFSNAWVLNTAEAMCVALTLDAEGDAAILKAQADFRAKLDEWIPVILAAQEPDGYFQTRYTLGTAREQQRGETPARWDPALRGDHEGYIAGYLIELGVAHHIATKGEDRRLYDAALKVADCWVRNIGPAPKKPWFDGHQEMEQALVRLGRYVNDAGGDGKAYIDLAKFLLDSRYPTNDAEASEGAGDFYTGANRDAEYDQSHRPITQQYAAVGHAVRAAYNYSALADVAMETGDPGYWSATRSIWTNIVDRKLYVTGGIGSGETSEGFGPDYSLPNGSAYVESCSSCGLLYMQHKLNLATREAKYADLYETTIYNAILGDVDLDGQNFTYTNALDSDEARYKWHVCPCCVGNIPRTLLMLPTWMYAKAADAVFVNLYAGSTVNVGPVAGTDVELLQETDYPWSGKVALTVNPARDGAEFAVHLRAPTREVSALYKAEPSGDGIAALKVNGEAAETKADAAGYVAVWRAWKRGDKIELELPLPVQIVTPAHDKVAATRGKVALRRGPLIYNVETADGQDVDSIFDPRSRLSADAAPDLLGGVVALRGTWADGTPLVAVPNYARLNRGGRSAVWVNRVAPAE